MRVEGEPRSFARVDGRRVRQILGNLVNNAIKFTQQGEVVVRVAREGGLASLSVTDTGPGISPQERAVIFQEYKQARSERMKRRGTGLGLAIARRLVMLHQGSIQVESELGRGSTFKVLLPDRQRRCPALDRRASGGSREGSDEPPTQPVSSRVSSRCSSRVHAVTFLLTAAFAPRVLLLEPASSSASLPWSLVIGLLSAALLDGRDVRR